MVYLDAAEQFAREPFSAVFRARQTGLEFVAATVHIVYGKRVADRTPEIHALREYWDWLAEIHPEHATRRLLLGDFNLRPGHDAWAELREVAQPLLTEGATTLSSNDRQYANLYDNIWVPANHDLPITEAGIMQFPILLSGTSPGYWNHEQARAHISDHAPVYAMLEGAQLHAVRHGQVQVPNRVTASAEPPAEPTCIDLNAAPPEDLEQLPHIGPGRAQAITQGRPWGSVNELQRISGISDARLSAIQASGLVCAH